MFLENKTTQAAARLIKLSGGKMPYLALMKLLYLADKRMLLTWGIPMTYDHWVSMKHGPVLSETLNLMKGLPAGDAGYWSGHVQKSGYDVSLTHDPGDELLSEAEDAIIDQVFAEHGSKDKWELVQYTHTFAEWSDPGDSSRRISYREVLENEGASRDTIEGVLKNIAAQEEMARAFA